MRRWGCDDFADEGGDSGADGGGHVTRTDNLQQAMESPEMEEWRKARRKKKCKMTRPNDKLVVGARMLCKRNMREAGEVEKYKCGFVTQGFWQVEGVHYTEEYSSTPATTWIRILWRRQPLRTENSTILMQSRHYRRRVLTRRYAFKISEEYQEFPGALGC